MGNCFTYLANQYWNIWRRTNVYRPFFSSTVHTYAPRKHLRNYGKKEPALLRDRYVKFAKVTIEGQLLRRWAEVSLYIPFLRTCMWLMYRQHSRCPPV